MSCRIMCKKCGTNSAIGLNRSTRVRRSRVSDGSREIDFTNKDRFHKQHTHNGDRSPDVSDTTSHCFPEYAEISNHQGSHFTECTEEPNKGFALLEVRKRLRHVFAPLRVRGFSNFRSRWTNLSSWQNLPSGHGAKQPREQRQRMTYEWMRKDAKDSY